MPKLEDHVVTINGIEYVPLEVAQKAVQEVFTYDKKLNTEMNKLDGYVRYISNILDDTFKEGKE
jgi:hypothetical protein